MIDEKLSEEEVQKHITHCFDSWNICEELSVKDSLTEIEEDRLKRNKEHIQIMLAKDWFSEGCTAEQKADLEKYL